MRKKKAYRGRDQIRGEEDTKNHKKCIIKGKWKAEITQRGRKDTKMTGKRPDHANKNLWPEVPFV